MNGTEELIKAVYGKVLIINIDCDEVYSSMVAIYQ